MRSLTTSALTAAALILTALPAVAGNWYGLISAGLVHSDNNYKEAVGAVNTANNQNPVNDADNSNVTAKLAVGCRVNDHFAVEAPPGGSAKVNTIMPASKPGSLSAATPNLKVTGSPLMPLAFSRLQTLYLFSVKQALH